MDTLTRLFRYAMTGGSAAVVDLTFFSALCPRYLPVAIAATLSFVCAALVNYSLTTVFVFQGGFSTGRLAKFFIFALCGLAFNVLVTILVAAVTPAPLPLAKAAGIGTAFFLNYWLNAVFVFAAKTRGTCGPATANKSANTKGHSG